MLDLKNVVSGYGKSTVLHDVSIHIDEGEIVTLIGANGAGKSTTLMTISGVVPIRSGEVLFGIESIHRKKPYEIVALGVNQVPEGRRIFPLLSVKENLYMGAFLRKDLSAIKKDLEYVFSLFPILQQRSNQQGRTLSGGEQQMLAIGRALMARPKLLLLDEPSLGLAPLLVKQMMEIIRQINTDHGTTVFLVEQNANLALRIADRGYVMETGNITLTGTGKELLSNDAVQEAYLGGA